MLQLAGGVKTCDLVRVGLIQEFDRRHR